MQLRGTKTLVVGMKRSGVATVQLLARHGAEIRATDLQPLEAARRRGARVIGEVELAAPFLQGKTIGITGSNGKTTTTSLTGHILHESGVPVQVGGNIGTP